MAITMCDCPIPEKNTFCLIAVAESKECLVPPAVTEVGTNLYPIEISLAIDPTNPPVVEVVCPGMLCVCGVITKTLTYRGVNSDGTTTDARVERTIYIPFQKCVEDCSINEGDLFEVGYYYTDCGCYQLGCTGTRTVDDVDDTTIYFEIREKDIVRIGVNRVELG